MCVCCVLVPCSSPCVLVFVPSNFSMHSWNCTVCNPNLFSIRILCTVVFKREREGEVKEREREIERERESK